ncbi:MAG: CDP-glycerol glycerophosphotransferase family protein, partial [Selenomonadaceae bacterium]|nr:CDP-glycerol glycerophosphotransferase family protein [Selenomonadaceae bacterium]
LRQSYLTAKYVFSHVKPGTIKFVLIGLAPNSFHYDNTQDFLYATRSLQYTFTFNEPNARDNLILNLFTDAVKDIYKKATYKQADINFDGIRAKIGNPVSAKGIVDWGKATESLTPKALNNNITILQKYIELCIANDAQPIGVLMPFLSATRKYYNTDLLKPLRKAIHQLGESHGFTYIDMFELKIGYDCFFDMMHLNSKGQIFTSAMLSLRLFNRGILSGENFLNLDYEYLKRLALVAPKDEYNTLMERIFEASAKRIANKKKIKIGFAMLEAAHWCGKDLYDFFARDKRFETTVFLSMDFHKEINDIVKKDFWDGVEQLKSDGLNVVALEDIDAKVPEQDVLIFLTPYLQYFVKAFQIQSMTPKTLLAYIPYAYDSSQHVKSFYSQMLVLVAWKIFFSSTVTFDLYKEKTIIGMPTGVYSGYPRMDIFFKQDAQFNFDWKMAQPDAKKIIWAPHHSIASTTSIVYATFQWNYQFMYEFAKNHPETSWVVKPHPWLLYTAVTDGVFETAEAFNEYIQAWNDLPNAQVVIGGYYQNIFATSDALIHDCGSFISEYQYVNNPMIYLTRDTQKHNKLGKEILNASYCVDGQDLDAIAKTIQQVIIDGDDYKAYARQEVFDNYLNYPKANGMLASEFIYKNISEGLME